MKSGKSEAEMNEIIKLYWVDEKNIVMLDGWPFAQFAYNGNSKTFYWDWGVPQFNIIYKK